MKITVLTLFPEMYEDFLKTSIIGRAIDRGLAEVEFVQIRDFAHDNYKHVDDRPFGGGCGQVMKCQPVLDALHSVKTDSSYTLMMSPAGHPYSQKKAHELSQKDHLIILCGHYEGLDARINDEVDELVSIGDYVLTGGELGAMVLVDCVARLVPGVLGCEESAQTESFSSGLLEYPQYTRPRAFDGLTVPEPLLNGNHAHIVDWQLSESLYITLRRRPEMAKAYLDGRKFTRHQQKVVDAVFDRIREEDEAAKAQTEEQP